MKLVLFTICSVVAFLLQNAKGAPKKEIKPTDEEPEEQENKSLTLIDIMEKDLDSEEKRPIQKKNLTNNSKKKPIPTKATGKDKKKGNKKSKQIRKKMSLQYLENDLQDRLLQEANNAKQSVELSQNVANNRIDKIKENYDSLNSGESFEQLVKSKQEVRDDSANSLVLEGTQKGKGLIRRTLGGSVEDETIEDDIELVGRRVLDGKRKFEDVYHYENESLKQMLMHLVMNAVNPSIKNAVKASKTAIDRYVKYTVQKAGRQAALLHTDYTSLRFDKDRIIMYCGGQMYVYNTLKDSKICFNGQVYEVRLM